MKTQNNVPGTYLTNWSAVCRRVAEEDLDLSEDEVESLCSNVAKLDALVCVPGEIVAVHYNHPWSTEPTLWLSHGFQSTTWWFSPAILEEPEYHKLRITLCNFYELVNDATEVEALSSSKRWRNTLRNNELHILAGEASWRRW